VVSNPAVLSGEGRGMFDMPKAPFAKTLPEMSLMLGRLSVNDVKDGLELEGAVHHGEAPIGLSAGFSLTGLCTTGGSGGAGMTGGGGAEGPGEKGEAEGSLMTTGLDSLIGCAGEALAAMTVGVSLEAGGVSTELCSLAVMNFLRSSLRFFGGGAGSAGG
jgi:hypothetical protein